MIVHGGNGTGNVNGNGNENENKNENGLIWVMCGEGTSASGNYAKHSAKSRKYRVAVQSPRRWQFSPFAFLSLH